MSEYNGPERRQECDNCVRGTVNVTIERLDKLIPIVYTMVGRVAASIWMQVSLLLISVIITAIVYIGDDARANDVANNKASIKTIETSLGEYDEIHKREAQETKEYRESVAKWMAETTEALKDIKGKL